MMKTYISKVVEFEGKLCMIIPKEICEELNIKEGTRLSVERSSDGKSIVMRKV